MRLDEQLRRLADDAPAPPPGDAGTTFRRGLRRRRWRRATQVTVGLLVVGVLGLVSATLTERSVRPVIAGQPADDSDGEQAGNPSTSEPVILEPPAATVSARTPFPWVVAVSPGEQGRWCVTAVRGATELGDQIGQPCAVQLVPDQGLTWGDTESGGPDHQQLSWGLAPTDDVVVEFADGTRRDAIVTPVDALDATLWAIGYENQHVQAIEARADGTVVAGAVALDGFDLRDLLQIVGALVTLLAALLAVRSWRARRSSRSRDADPTSS